MRGPAHSWHLVAVLVTLLLLDLICFKAEGYFFPLYFVFQGLAEFPGHWMTVGAGHSDSIAVFFRHISKVALSSICSNENSLRNKLSIQPIST